MIISLILSLAASLTSLSAWAAEPAPIRLPDSIMLNIVCQQAKTTRLEPSEHMVRDTMLLTALRLRKLSMASKTTKRLIEDPVFTQMMIQAFVPEIQDALKREFDAMCSIAIDLAQHKAHGPGQKQLHATIAAMQTESFDVNKFPRELFTILGAMAMATPTSLQIVAQDTITYTGKGRWAINRASRSLEDDPQVSCKTTQGLADQKKLPIDDIMQVDTCLAELKSARDQITQHLIPFEILDPLVKKLAPRTAIIEGNALYGRTKLSRNPLSN